MPIALGIETSCDDCSVSLVTDQAEVLFLSTQNQDALHCDFQGVVPELASRRHENQILPLIEQALKQVPLSKISLIASTNRPGLLGSLLVACLTAKTLSFAYDKPLVGVNHLEAHIFSSALFKSEQTKQQQAVKFPALAFVVSGGHSSLFNVQDVGKSILIASSRDDAAGEAFDKFARLLNYPWPGGKHIDQLALNGIYDSKNSFFTKIKTKDLSFSFSGIKSQAQRLLANKNLDWIKKHKKQLCIDYQHTIVDHLMDKLALAFESNTNYKQILVGGGVSANSLFRKRLMQWSKNRSIPCLFPQKEFCTDNGAMIAFLGLKYFLKGQTDDLNMLCSPQNLDSDFFIQNL